MYIEKNSNTGICTIWVDKEHVQDYKNDARYKEAVLDSKAAGYSICVYVSGDLPILPAFNELLSPNVIVM